MKNLIIALKSEYIKARHQKTWLMVLITGALLPILYGIITSVEGPRSFNDLGVANNFFNDVFSVAHGFALVFLPFGIATVTAQIVSVEHKNNTWQLIETQPIPKWSIYFAKYLKVIITTFFIVAIFFLIMYGVLFAIYHIFNLDPTQYILKFEFGKTMNLLLNIWMASFSLTATLFAAHMLINKTNLITSVALIAILGYSMSKALNMNISSLVSIVQLDKAAAGFSAIGDFITFFSRLSIVQSLVILAIGYVLYYYKNYRFKGFKNKQAIVKLATLLLIGGAIVTWMHLPKFQRSYGKTIIAGQLTGDKKIDTLLLINNDNIPFFQIPIQSDGKFHMEIIDSSIVRGPYYLYVQSLSMAFMNERGINTTMFWGTGDSVYAALSINNNVPIGKFSGDRQAENKYAHDYQNKKLSNLIYSIENKYANFENVDDFIKKLKKEYNTDVKSSYNAVTIDGLKVAPDVQKSTLSLFNLKALEAWKTFMVNYPQLVKAEGPLPEFIQQLKDGVDLKDRSLLAHQNFRDFYYTTLNDGKAQIKDVDRLTLIEKIQDEQVKEDMYFDAFCRLLNNNVLEDSVVFNIIDANRDKLNKKNLMAALGKAYFDRKANSNIETLPPYFFEDENGKEQGLQQYLGKYVVVDVWATWCAPCKYNAPYFYELADKYEGKNIVFIALSTDENVAAWKKDKSVSANIVNWITTKNNPFMQRFAISGIPRFILIGPDGKPINSKMPAPSDKNFETILKQYVSL